MTPRAATLCTLFASTACFSPDGAVSTPEGSSGGALDTTTAAGQETSEGAPESSSDASGGAADATSPSDPASEDPAASSGAAESSSGDGDWSTSSGSTGRPPLGICGDGQVDNTESCDDGNNEDFDGCDHACAEEMCGYAFAFVDGECRSGMEAFCTPMAAETEMQAACEACTGAPCERKTCTLGLGGSGTVWTPKQQGGGFIEHPMGFVDAAVPYGFGDAWPWGTILADICTGTRIGGVVE